MRTIDRISKIKNGKDLKLYEFLGSHTATKNGKKGAYFRVYAPNAKAVFVCGDFNNWDKSQFPLRRIKDSEIWEVFVPKAKNMQRYKYIVVDENDIERAKSDPFAYYGEAYSVDKDFSSYIYNLDGYKWNDKKYLDSVKDKNYLDSPINIYEVCLLTWKKHADGSYYT